MQSVRTQGAGTLTYTATAIGSTSISYSLDPASLAAGNTINSSTGTITWVAAWNGASQGTATATGCGGTSTSMHIIAINPTVVQAPLYLSTPGQALDRIDPVATGITITEQSATLSSTGLTSTSFTQTPALCSDLTIVGQAVSVVVYVSVTSGSMPSNPAITALIRYGSTNIISFSNPIYNPLDGTLTWSGIFRI